ncbi:MAG: hypothetical protein ACP5NW_02740 [Candidatus Woesearchaeota archaeon]
MSTMNQFIIKKLRRETFTQRVAKRMRVIFLSRAKTDMMRKVLIQDAKPYFFKALSDSKIDQLTKKYYDERINTLSKETLLDVYETFIEVEKSFKEGDASATYYFITSLSLCYSINGWFLHKLAKVLSSKEYLDLIVKR